MKANSKRKVFGDAVDLLMGDMEEVTMPRGVQMVPVKSIQPFHDHPFHLYEGERLEDMIASVKEHGVLNPVIVQKLDTGYEMLSGHNRWNAAKLAGIKEIPAIVKTGLSEEEAYVYVIETNLMQRSFSDLAISEKAAVLKARYEKGSCQGKRNDILNEIARLEGKQVADVTCGHSDHKLKTRDSIGKEYELSGSSVGRLLKLNDLIKPFKDMVDRGTLYTKVALQLAFLPENEQTMVYEIMKEKKTKITIEMVMKLRSHSGALTEAMVKRYLSREPIKKKCYKVPARIVEKYFEGMDPNQVDSIVEWLQTIDTSQAMCKKDSLINNRNDLFMSFNYTDTLEKVYGIKDVLHLHGGIPSCCEIAPIMGHGNKYIIDSYCRKAKEAQEEYVEWYESICNAIADFCESLYKDTDAIISENDDFFSALWDVNQVVCLGLSFGDVDVPYLDRIEYEVRPETKWLVYYHSDEDLKRLKSVFGITGISRKFEVYFRKSDNFWDR